MVPTLSPLHVQIRANTMHPAFPELLQTVDEVLDKDAASSRTAFVNRTQQCFAVKGGVDSFLDLARSSFCRISEDIHELAAKYREIHSMDSLKARQKYLSHSDCELCGKLQHNHGYFSVLVRLPTKRGLEITALHASNFFRTRWCGRCSCSMQQNGGFILWRRGRVQD